MGFAVSTPSALLRSLDELGECPGVVHSHLGEHLPVDLDVVRLQPGDQLVIGGPVLTGSRIDTGDPQTPKLALSSAPVPIGVLHRMHDLLIGGPVSPAPGTLVALGAVEDLLMPLLGVNR